MKAKQSKNGYATAKARVAGCVFQDAGNPLTFMAEAIKQTEGRVIIDSRRCFTKRQAKIKLAQCDSKCERCGNLLENGFHMHHVKPHSQGGQTVLTNCMAVCVKCHREIHNEH